MFSGNRGRYLVGSVVILWGTFYVSLLRVLPDNNDYDRFPEALVAQQLAENARNRNDSSTTLAYSTTIKPKTLWTKLSPSFSSVDYFACCGAGHRFSKLADAYYLAKRVQFSLRVFFGYCADQDQEVFSYFFGPQPYDEAKAMAKSTMRDMVLKISNEAPGFEKLVREGPNTTCRCTEDRLEADVALFRGLRERFRARDRVESFRNEFFTNHTVIGMHVRAGNGETGDFERKNRTIADTSKWQKSVANLLVDMSASWTHTHPPLLFIATDTARIIASFKALLSGKMTVVDLSQDRMDHGKGVLFGSRGNVTTTGHECIDGWEDVFTDMMILSHADVVVAARPSSFTQSIPMTLALSTEKARRKVKMSYCEVNPTATEYVCYEDLTDWCCNGVTSFSLQGIQRYDYRRMPRLSGINENDYEPRIHPRPSRPDDCIPIPPGDRADCLPYQFPTPAELEPVKEKARWRQHMRSRQIQAREIAEENILN